MVKFIKELLKNKSKKEGTNMNKNIVLYIKGNPSDEMDSYSLSVGRDFINKYKEINPNDEVVEVNVYEDNIPMIDKDVLKGWGKLQSGKTMEDLTKEEREKIVRIDELTEQFLKADKYVFSTPMWNLGLPPMVKAYMDTVIVARKTFKYTENGPVGLLQDKKAIHIHSTGGVYSEGPAKDFVHAHSYMESALSFMGIQDIKSIVIEGTAYMPKDELKNKASQDVKEVVKNF
ncbi:FMN-dependent NADH-azoreductase [Clostridium hydrogeniformans]|uniref:FMN-dependent NADH-azoreductase n=1 Tax=Clostridium hydrogeniformans TaxID=349933 RepID=UPI000A81FAA7|nr:FMN-dependent NADH-azoreductase [Clostridium hydrogeniformans]